MWKHDISILTLLFASHRAWRQTHKRNATGGRSKSLRTAMNKDCESRGFAAVTPRHHSGAGVGTVCVLVQCVYWVWRRKEENKAVAMYSSWWMMTGDEGWADRHAAGRSDMLHWQRRPNNSRHNREGERTGRIITLYQTRTPSDPIPINSQTRVNWRRNIIL